MLVHPWVRRTTKKERRGGQKRIPPPHMKGSEEACKREAKNVLHVSNRGRKNGHPKTKSSAKRSKNKGKKIVLF